MTSSAPKTSRDADSRLISAVWPGQAYPRGATWDGEGVNFSLFSDNSEKVELCIFDSTGRHEIQRIEVRERTDGNWNAYLPEARPGFLYGYRVYGPYDPGRGHRFNPNKLLIEPYAKALHGSLVWSDAHFGYRTGSAKADLSFDRRDSAPGTPKCAVIDSAFTWGDDRPPRIPWHDTVIYEGHVRGLSMRHPGVPAPLRGTYAGLATAPIVDHLVRLGITAIELMPVHAFVDDRHLLDKGLRNYWGYNTLGFFAPEIRYSATGRISEFKTMVKVLHSAGIEVLLDVVYNHTAEGNQLGPTLSFRGIDNASYYRLSAENPRYYVDFTGTGNTLNLQQPRVLQLLMDSLRYWVLEMHVDGFRFDLASALARELHEVDRLGSFFDTMGQDPVLSQVKLIAEPWDIGSGGYQVGNFPPGWNEWNDKYRDTLRGYWKGDGGLLADFARRFTGSPDLYEASGRKPHASINFVTAHDGFTLEDLVSYNDKHNEKNGEDNRDGHNDNRSWNWGVEGATEDPAVLALRMRHKRNLLASLMLSQGVPMILGGDELSRTQQGNNNAYCQDNETGWVGWQGLGREGDDLTDFIGHMTGLRRRFPQIRTHRWLDGRRADGSYGVLWLTPAAEDMKQEDWNFPEGRFLAYVLGPTAPGGEPIFIVLNAAPEQIAFKLPKLPEYKSWQQLLNTADVKQTVADFASGSEAKAPPRSVLAFAGSA